ncbi:CBU_0592 family membrane protein [Lactococcus termiticola]
MQILGSVLILIPFVLAQLKYLSVKSRLYLYLNALGSLMMAVDALIGHQWGFLLLEGTWCVVSVGSIIALSKRSKKH